MASVRIAIFGGMKTGKTTLAQALAKNHPTVPIDHFAYPLYDAMEALLGADVKDRAFLQDVSGYMTARDDACFVKLLQARHPEFLNTGLIIADGRRAIEYAWAKALGFVMVKLEAPREVRIERGAEPDRIDHPVETALDFLPQSAWDAVIDTSLFSVYTCVNWVESALRDNGMAQSNVRYFTPKYEAKTKDTVRLNLTPTVPPQVPEFPADYGAVLEALRHKQEKAMLEKQIQALLDGVRLQTTPSPAGEVYPYWLDDIPPSEEELEFHSGPPLRDEETEEEYRITEFGRALVNAYGWRDENN